MGRLVVSFVVHVVTTQTARSYTLYHVQYVVDISLSVDQGLRSLMDSRAYNVVSADEMGCTRRPGFSNGYEINSAWWLV